MSHLMTLCRKALDHLPPEERERYPILKFFCNWAMHITLDRSLEGMAILKRLNDTLVELAESHTDPIIKKVTELISFRKLRCEMRTLLEYLAIAPLIVDDQSQWENFAKHLIEIIRDCPLGFGEKMARDAAVTAKWLSNRGWVTGVSVVEVDYGLLKGRDSHKILCIHVLMSDTTHIMIPMDAYEVFGPPDEAHTPT